MADNYETPYDRMNRKNREAAQIRDAEAEQKKAIGKVKPGDPYYQPEDEAPNRALTRAKAQGEYIKNYSNLGDNYQRDEGIFADTIRAVKNYRAGKRGRDVIEYGDPVLRPGARDAGNDAVDREARSETKRELRGGSSLLYKKGGSVSASSRGDGIAQRGKTKGRMC
jgi:hypothetical protein